VAAAVFFRRGLDIKLFEMVAVPDCFRQYYHLRFIADDKRWSEVSFLELYGSYVSYPHLKCSQDMQKGLINVAMVRISSVLMPKNLCPKKIKWYGNQRTEVARIWHISYARYLTQFSTSYGHPHAQNLFSEA